RWVGLAAAIGALALHGAVAVSNPSAATGLPLELAELDAQFQAVQQERVTAPFAAGVARLDQGYLGGLEREIASERTAGNLDGVLALEAEKKRIEAGQPLPDEDEDAT